MSDYELKSATENFRIAAVCLAMAVVMLIGGAFWIGDLHDDNSRLTQLVEHDQKTYLNKQWSGSLCTPGPIGENMQSFHFKSFDGGKIWYAVKLTKEDAVEILGKAEKLHPGVLKCHDGWGRLTDHVLKHGPIDPTNSEDVGVLNDAGITVEWKK